MPGCFPAEPGSVSPSKGNLRRLVAGRQAIIMVFYRSEENAMQDSQLYQQILGITTPWRVERVELRLKEGEVHVYLGHEAQVP